MVNTQDTPIELGECFTITDLVPLADSPTIEVGSGLARVNLMNVETGKIISLSGSTRKIQNMFDLVYEEDTHVSEPSEKIIEIGEINSEEYSPDYDDINEKLIKTVAELYRRKNDRNDRTDS